MYAAIDNVEKTMARLLKRRKEKMVQRRQQPAELPVTPEAPENEYQITRVKKHKLLTMTAQEACEEVARIMREWDYDVW
jgi:hypothetical protein